MMSRMPAVEHRYAEVDGLRLHALDFGGPGRPTILLHGVGGSAWTWVEVAAGLDAASRAVAVDLRGYGDSQWSAGRDYTTATHASDVRGLCERLGLDEVDVVGFSWGGLVGIALATAWPGVRRLAVVDIAPSSPLDETDVLPLPYLHATHAEAIEGERRLAPRAGQEVLERAVAGGTRPAEGGMLVRKLDPFFLERWPFRADDRWSELAQLGLPVLVVRGGESPVLSAGDAAHMVETLPAGRLATIADCGHLIPLERPTELATALREFLA